MEDLKVVKSLFEKIFGKEPERRASYAYWHSHGDFVGLEPDLVFTQAERDQLEEWYIDSCSTSIGDADRTYALDRNSCVTRTVSNGLVSLHRMPMTIIK